MSLSQAQIDSFNEHGYLRYGKILDDAEIEHYRRAYDQMFDDANSRVKNLSAPKAAPGETPGPANQRMLQIFNCCEQSIAFRKLLYDTRILDILQDLIGPNIMLFHDQALFKPAFTGGPVVWHQDNAYWKCRPATLVSCWLTLDDVKKENGAMQVIPGSHLKPVWHEDTKTVLVDSSKQVDESKALVVDLPAGGCMFHHCQTLHYTQENTTPNQRRAFAMHFMNPGTTRTNGDSRELLKVSFTHPLLRCAI